MAHPQTRKREISALAEAMRELNLTDGVIVTRKDDEQLQVESGTISVTSAWRFLLDLPF